MNLVTVTLTRAKQIKHQLNTLLQGRSLVRNASWMLVAEGSARASRLVTIIVLGLCLSPAEYGLAMLAIVCHELMRVFTRVGSGAKVVQCDEHDLAGYASNAATLQWVLCLALTSLQVATADTIAHYYNNPGLGPLLKVMALSNLLYPLVTVRVFLVQRSNDMRFLALASAVSIMVENFSTALFALGGFGVMSVALAKVCSALCWVIFFYHAKTARYAPGFCRHYMKRLTTFSSKILTSELLKSLRLQVDSLFAARMLSPELFGLYSFAKSAGVGLSQSVSAGYMTSLYPYLCEQQRKLSMATAIRDAYKVAAGISIIFLVQAAAAPVYLDLLFDERWQGAATLVSILCLTAIPALCMDTTNTILRAQNRPRYEVYLSLYSLLTLVAALYFVQPRDAIECATVVALTSLSWLPVVFFSRERPQANPMASRA